MSTVLSQKSAGREKYWSELSSKEKIERLRDIVRCLKEEVRDIRIKVSQVSNHKHDENGEAVIIKRMGYLDHEVCERKPEKRNDDVYF